MIAKQPDMVFACPVTWPEVSLPFHLGLGYLVTYLRSQGIAAEHFVDNEPVGVQAMARDLASRATLLVGLTCYDSTYYLVRSLARAIKALRPAILVVIGGPSTVAEASFILKDCQAIDLCLRGEAEITFFNVARRILDHRDYTDLPSLTFRQGSEIVQTPDCDLPIDLAMVPSPYLPFIVPLEHINRLHLETGRGCPWHCTYCANPGLTRKVRRHSVDRIVAEAEAIHDWLSLYRKKETWPIVFLNDDDFLQNKAHATEICQALVARGIRLPIWVNCRVGQGDRELFRLMAEAGIVEVNFGLESASPKVLRAIHKVSPLSTPDDPPYEQEERFLTAMRQGVADMRAAGIRRVTVSTIFGLPHETKSDAQRTINFVRSLNVDSYQHNILQIYSGTTLSQNYKRYQLELEPSLLGLPRRTIHSYDVSSVERLPNDAWRSFAVERFERILPALSGIGFKDPWRGTTFLVEREAPKPATVLPDLAPWLGCESRVLILDAAVDGGWHQAIDEGLEPGYLWSIDPQIASVATPPDHNHPFSIFELELVPSHKFIDRLYTGTYHFIRMSFWGGSEAAEPPANTVRLWWMKDVVDAEALTQMSSEGADISNYENVVIDSCRWGSSPCPARDARRAVIGQDGRIRPCPAGAVVSWLNMGPDSLRLKMKDLGRRLRLERGCDSCPVESTCSQCPFPVVPAETFCRIRREHPDLPNMLTQVITPLYVKLFRLIPDKAFKLESF
jgi:radical SAM superfamily enzyme YgiQ (UPF0313 family)